MNNNFDGLVQSSVGIDEAEKWQYEGMGYNASDGIFYVGQEQVNELTLTCFALRQCKEVTDSSGNVHRYPIRTAKNNMAEGDVTYRLQVVCSYDGQLYTFGARAFTARASFVNPEKGHVKLFH